MIVKFKFKITILNVFSEMKTKITFYNSPEILSMCF